MSLSRFKTLGLFTAAFALATAGNISTGHDLFFETPAQAADGCFPGVYNPSSTVKPGDCYTPAEFNKAMKAEGQQPIFVGDRVERYGNYFTSSADGSKGYNAEMDVPYERKTEASTIRIASAYIGVKANDVNASKALPAWGRLNIDDSKAQQYCNKFKGACSTYNNYIERNTLEGGSKQDNRLMMLAQSIDNPSSDGKWTLGKKIAIFRDMNTGLGEVADLSSSGAITPSFGLRPISQTQFADRLIKEQRASNDGGQTILAALTP